MDNPFYGKKGCIISREVNWFPYLLCLEQRSKTSSCCRLQNSGSAPAYFWLPVANKRSRICFKTNRQYRLVQRAYKTQDKCIFKARPTFKLILLFLSPRTCKQGGKNARAGKNPNIFQNWSILSCFTVQLTLTDKQQYVVFHFIASSIDRLLIPSKVSQLH